MGSYRTYSIPSKTAALVPEFALEDLPSAELQPRFLALAVKDLPLRENKIALVCKNTYERGTPNQLVKWT